MAIEAGKTPVSRPPHVGQGSGTAPTQQRAAASASTGVNSFAAMLADVDVGDAQASDKGASIVETSPQRDESHGIADGQRELRSSGERGERRRPRVSTRATVDADADAVQAPAKTVHKGNSPELGTSSGVTAPLNAGLPFSLALPQDALAGSGYLPQQVDTVGDSMPVRAHAPQLRALSSTQQLQNFATVNGHKGLRTGSAGNGLVADAQDAASLADSALAKSVFEGKAESAFLGGLVPSRLESSGAEAASGIMDMVTNLIGSTGNRERSQETSPGQVPTSMVPERAEGAFDDIVDAPGHALLGDEIVQEPVRFWLGSDQSQQAELTVDDVAGASVDVTVRMYGKETQIAFHSDERVARDALQAHSSHLKSLLGQEGLTLTSLTVGTSENGAAGGFGQGGSSKDAGNAKGARVERVRVNAEDAVVSLSSTPSSRGSGGGGAATRLDLYV